MFENLPDIDLRQMRAFAIVAEELHFGRAAERLGIAQPPLSQQIRRLEAKVGCQLFDRGTRRVELTEAGRALLATARRILVEAANGVEQARRVGRGDAGILDVGFPATVALSLLPKVIRAFRQRYPGIELRLSELTTSPQRDALRTGGIDVGFLREPEPDSLLQMETVMLERFIAVLPSTHRLATSRASISLPALAGEPFILFRRDVGPLFHGRILGLCGQAGFAPRIVQESGEWQTVVSLVRAGLGVSIAPQCVANLRLEGVTYKALTASRVRTSVVMCWHKDNRRTALQRFIDVTRRVTREERSD
ncbi:MAG: LysR family transcriptional regulator [Reyranella sp.]|jgi:DNA-binding transcriptional LysR family regulator|uniref:LysR family transcriptional regulator n=1 Tax=Reyranella sp. TaxID=1929291 RepID=UPI00096909C5|nr:LysR family transcriptional regulator [Reyranella sp.]MBN9541484.1 LysR family transcriptional regulator [Alphaproteobacteria bacterium]MBR2814473.1 LysR family transcriptional regulator [Reyranella sp.]OJU44285.1 MAG: LysR family transcriptional regulator [Alphaproteobacteria bacterium 65-37]